MRIDHIHSFHQLDELRQRLRDCGAKPCHEQRVLRAWLQARPIDSGARRHRPEDFLPLGIRSALPELTAKLDGLARVQMLVSTVIWLSVVACGRWIAYL